MFYLQDPLSWKAADFTGASPHREFWIFFWSPSCLNMHNVCRPKSAHIAILEEFVVTACSSRARPWNDSCMDSKLQKTQVAIHRDESSKGWNLQHIYGMRILSDPQVRRNWLNSVVDIFWARNVMSFQSPEQSLARCCSIPSHHSSSWFHLIPSHGLKHHSVGFNPFFCCLKPTIFLFYPITPPSSGFKAGPKKQKQGQQNQLISNTWT